MNFNVIIKTVIKIYTSNKIVREFFNNKVKLEVMSNLVDKLGETRAALKNTNYLTVPVIIPYNIIITKALDKIINIFKTLALFARATI